MILTLTWKELREHQGVWLTMAIMTVGAAWGLPHLVAMGDRNLGTHVAALTLLGLAATYGVVCGSMMFAGEHEGGTLVFLDIFHGRRGLLWLAKFAIGAMLVVAQAVAVALTFGSLKQEAPAWAMAIVGQNAHRPNAIVWLLILPVVSLEAYAWGLLGSSLTRRVLAGAAVAAVGVTPVWLLAIITSPPVFFTFQLVVAGIVLVISYASFVYQSREGTRVSPLKPEGPLDSKEDFLEQWEEFERDDVVREQPRRDIPVTVPAAPLPSAANPTVPKLVANSKPSAPAPPPNEVLWWLTFQQAWPVLWILAGACLLAGLVMPANAQVLWPLATLLLGVVCGTAAFAPEQRDLSYQFLAAQHFPLKAIWRFKILFWLTVAVLGAVVILFGHTLNIVLRDAAFGPRGLPASFAGTVVDRVGPTSFFAIWLVYGFGAGQLFVWLCRKSILAVLISFLVGVAVMSLWLPSLLCGGMSGWQLWAPPLTMVLATWFLLRAWAGGRIQERKPMAALAGFGMAVIVWMFMSLGYRALEIPDVGTSIDPVEFRATLPLGKDNAAARAVDKAIEQYEDRDDRWLASIAEMVHLPGGMLEAPRASLQPPLLKHLQVCREMADELLRRARLQKAEPALEHLAQVLALSRNLRNKASLDPYLAGVEMEKDALKGLDQWLARGKPDPKLLRRVLQELDRHVVETPSAIDCLRTECFRSGGFLLNPTDLVLPAPGEAGKVAEPWLRGTIALSLEVPWEQERNTRLWQLVWAGHFRALETPHWQLPTLGVDAQTATIETRMILQGWLPATEGPGAGVTRAHMIRLLDRSWLGDDRLFCSVVRLRESSTRARCRVEATRLAIALSLYQIDEGKSAKDLQDLVPKYLPGGLPIDPYSGQSFRYRIAPDNDPLNETGAVPGQGIVWSTGPDRIDHGGRRDGSHLPDDDPQWLRGDFDLITLVPHWP